MLAPLLAIACQGASGPPTSDIVSSIPWTAPESLDYRLVNDDGEEQATGTLSIEVSDGNTKLVSHFERGANSDTTVVVVDSQTLKPLFSRRMIENDNPDDEDLLEVEYTDEGALIRAGDRQSGLSVDEHAYDNDTSLFLWRTIAFAEGYEASYNTIITNQRTKQRVILRVTGTETVTVPAGQFEAWRLEIFTSNARQFAWYAVEGARPLLRYDNDRGTIFELVSPPD